MTKRNKHISLIMAIVMTVLSAVFLSSCGPEPEENVFLVYYVNSARDDIIYKPCKVEGQEEMTPEELTDYLLVRMFETDLSQDQMFSATLPGVEINSYKISDGYITLDFNSGYLEQTNVQEILLRAALVLTMIQEPAVSQVIFTVNGNPLTDSAGKAIGAMNASNFVNILLSEEGMLKQETDLTIYFTDETGTRLIPAKYHFTISNNNSSMEEYILQQLKEGPAIESTYRTMAADVNILSVATSGDICYVNFGSNFLEQEQPVGDDILIYSIVNSLCSLDYVSSVQFLIDGSPDVILHTVTDLSSPLTPKKELEQ
ncbi:MAG: GerMN domain-containing protein [Parasporobacterium sp.]|nr:GerMN domain-containing protein [Parasporobacterium sp.]